MKLGRVAAILTCLVLTAGVRAGIDNIVVANDGDGAINCLANWAPTAEGADLNIVGDQFWGPGHMIGTIYAPADPTVTVRNMVDNDTGYAWTGYTVNVKMSVPFTITLPTVYAPLDWSGVVTQAPVLVGSEYIGQIVYTAGTLVQPSPTSPSTLDFGYKITFTGTTSYCQEMIPVPEPATLAVVGLLALGGLIRRR